MICCCLAKAQQSKLGVSLTPAIVQTPWLKLGVQPGIEFRINDRLFLLTEITFVTHGHNDSSSRNSKYFRIKPELRYTLCEPFPGFKIYGGLQVAYSYRKWDNLNEGCYNIKNENTYKINYTKCSIKSPIFTSSLQVGALIPASKHFYFDFFMGLGVRTIFTDYYNVENASTDAYNTRVCKIFPSPDPAYWVNGTLSRFHSNIGLRFLYRF
jgi:hypothetical protein